MSIEAPTGSVTLVFTDIEASTVLWERVPDLMRSALELHDACMREAIEEHGGYEVRTEGDAFKVAFATPDAAVKWALDVQKRLMDLPWPAGLAEQPQAADVENADGKVVLRGLRVRMGGHTGFPDCRVHPTTGRMEYDGPMVNETARIAAAPHGGQLLVSGMLWETARRAADLSHVTCIDMGKHRLKGVREPEQLFELRSPDVGGRSFDPLRTETVRNTNLKPPPTPLVGRNRELERVGDCFKQGARLVSLLGPGGTGKTRLATEFGLGQVDDYASSGGVWFCDLEETVDLAGVCAQVGRKLSLPLNSANDPRGAANLVGRALKGLSPVLLVLDNLEQVVEPGREAVRTWMNEASDARFLVTSREPLELAGEQQVALTGLSAADARQLFVDHVKRVKPSFSPSPEDEEAIETIVKQLDCMPLAIELAAARANVLSPAAISKRLSQRFRLLASRSGTHERQGTLRNAIDWSWNLLDEAERAALAQCSVFAGGFTIEAAEAVLDLDDIEGAPWPMDVVGSLERKSLLHTRDQDGEVRLGQYQSIQAYARERLQELGNADALAERHAAYYAEQADLWAAATDTERELAAFRWVMLETDNLRAAHATSLKNDPPRACRLTRAMGKVLAHAGPGQWFDDMLDQAIELSRELGDTALQAELLSQRARAHRLAARPDAARIDSEAAVELARAGGHDHLEAEASLGLGLLRFYGVLSEEEARQVFDRALEASQRAKDELREVAIREQLAFLDRDPEEALRLARKMAQLNAPILAAWLYNIAFALFYELERMDEARKAMVIATALREPFGIRHEDFGSHAYVALLDLREGKTATEDLDAAEEAIRPVDAPGKHYGLDVLRAGDDILLARAQKDADVAGAEAHARELIERLTAPGEPTADSPDGTKSWAARSIWVKFAIEVLESVLERDGD